MIQDIYPSKLNNQYKNVEIAEGDYIMHFNEKGEMVFRNDSDSPVFPQYAGVADRENAADIGVTDARSEADTPIYLFSIDDKKYFLSTEEVPSDLLAHYSYYSVRDTRDKLRGADVYAAFTAYHLWKWYNDNKYCGRCGHKLNHDLKERALKCDACGNMVFPRINPAVIVGVINGDSILITKYRTGYAHSALIAGFTEIGETLEETVIREVMEEAGIKVKNIRYYKSQPWGMAEDILMGFYCEVDGDTTIRMDRNELKYAEWVKRDDIVLQPNNLSLTNEMMQMFKNGNEKNAHSVVHLLTGEA